MPDTPVLWLLVDARESEGLSVERLHLVAVDASVTVSLAFDGLLVGEDRVVGIEPFSTWRERDAAGLRTNGSLALGLARRCARLLGGTIGRAVEEQVIEHRHGLDGADARGLPRARAAASELALEAATSLVIETGGRAALVDSLAQLLARQAIFLLVFGQTPAIKTEQMGPRGRR
jgi:hypothetical protein